MLSWNSFNIVNKIINTVDMFRSILSLNGASELPTQTCSFIIKDKSDS